MDLLSFFRFVCLILFYIKERGCSNQAFIQINNELLYLDEEVPAVAYDNMSDDGTLRRPWSDHGRTSIRFEPAQLQFSQHPVGMPNSKMVQIFNPSETSFISLLSISGNTMHFHCTFFKDKLVPPLGNTSMSVIFLGRHTGPVHSHIFIHSSVGSFQYEVTAEGVPNPYGLRPLVGVRLPLNARYSLPIVMYNPHRSPLQVLEMYSSGGDLHLELPSDSTAPTHAKRDLSNSRWRLQPFNSATLLRVTFMARKEINHTAFIRIKTNHTVPYAPYLVIPVEVEVTSQRELFSPLRRLEFGATAARGRAKSLLVPVYNANGSAVHVKRVYVRPANAAVCTHMITSLVPAHTINPVIVGRVTFNPEMVQSDDQLSGMVVIEYSDSGNTLQLPYSVELVRGQLLIDKKQLVVRDRAAGAGGVSSSSSSSSNSSSNSSSSSSSSNSSSNSSSSNSSSNDTLQWTNVGAMNVFPLHLAVHTVRLSAAAARWFQVRWSGPCVISVNQSLVLFSVRAKRTPVSPPLATFVDAILIKTNLTDVSLPLTFRSDHITVLASLSPANRSVAVFVNATVLERAPDGEFQWRLGTVAGLQPVVADVFVLADDSGGGGGGGGGGWSCHVSNWSSDGDSGAAQLHAVALCSVSSSSSSSFHSAMSPLCTRVEASRRQVVLQPGRYLLLRAALLTGTDQANYTVPFHFVTKCHHRLRHHRHRHRQSQSVRHRTLYMHYSVQQPPLETRPDLRQLPAVLKSDHWEVGVSLRSTFATAVTVNRVTPLFDTDGAVFHDLSNSTGSPGHLGIELRPGVWTRVGSLVWNMSYFRSRMYHAHSARASVVSEWRESTALHLTTPDLDRSLLARQRHSLATCGLSSSRHNNNNTSSSNNTTSLPLNGSLILHLSSPLSPLSPVSLPVHVRLARPSLVTEPCCSDTLTFPATQLGEVSYQNITLHNPSSEPVCVQLVLLSDYPHTPSTDHLLQQLVVNSSLFASNGDNRRARWSDVSFALLDTIPSPYPTSRSSPLSSSSYSTSYRANVDHNSCECVPTTTTAAAAAPNTLVAFLAANATKQYSVAFQPQLAQTYSHLLLLRNNLTVIESVPLVARGARFQLLLAPSGGASSRSTALVFNLSRTHPLSCAGPESNDTEQGSVRVARRSVTLYNPSGAPLLLQPATIGGHACADAGFRLLHCGPLTVLGHGSVRLTVLFAADYTETRVQRPLEVRSAAGHVLLRRRLEALVAPELLGPCAAALPRPRWEPLLHLCGVGTGLLLVLTALLAALFESERVFSGACTAHSTAAAAAAAATTVTAKGRALAQSAATPSLSVLDLGAVVKDLRLSSAREQSRSSAKCSEAPATGVSVPCPTRPSVSVSSSCCSLSSSSSVTPAESSCSVLRRRRAKKAAKNLRRASHDFTCSALLQPGDDNSLSPAAAASSAVTVIEDVASTTMSTASPGRATTATATTASARPCRTVWRDRSEDRSSSTTDRSCSEEATADKHSTSTSGSRSSSKVSSTRSPCDSSPRATGPSPASSLELDVATGGEYGGGGGSATDSRCETAVAQYAVPVELPYKLRNSGHCRARHRDPQQQQQPPAAVSTNRVRPVLNAAAGGGAVNGASDATVARRQAPPTRCADVVNSPSAGSTTPAGARMKVTAAATNVQLSSFARVVSGAVTRQTSNNTDDNATVPRWPTSEQSSTVQKDGRELSTLVTSSGSKSPGVIGHSRPAHLSTDSSLFDLASNVSTTVSSAQSSLGLASLSQLAVTAPLLDVWPWTHGAALLPPASASPATSSLSSSSSMLLGAAAAVASSDVWLGADPATRGSSSHDRLVTSAPQWSPLHSRAPHQRDWPAIHWTADLASSPTTQQHGATRQ